MNVLTANTTAVLFLDVQEKIFGMSRTVTAEVLTRNTSVLAELAALHRMPAFLSAVPSGGDYVAGVRAAFDALPVRNRNTTTAFGDQALRSDLEATGRKTVLLCGAASEIVVQHTALDALAAGYAVQVAVDACGGLDARSEEAVWRRLVAAGAVTTSVIAVAGELTGDSTTDIGKQTRALMFKAAGG